MKMIFTWNTIKKFWVVCVCVCLCVSELVVHECCNKYILCFTAAVKEVSLLLHCMNGLAVLHHKALFNSLLPFAKVVKSI